MKRIHINRKKTILFAGIAVSLVAATFIPKAVRAHSRRKHVSV